RNIRRCSVPVMRVRSQADARLPAVVALERGERFRIAARLVAAQRAAVPFVLPKTAPHVVAAAVRVAPHPYAELVRPRGLRSWAGGGHRSGLGKFLARVVGHLANPPEAMREEAIHELAERTAHREEIHG